MSVHIHPAPPCEVVSHDTCEGRGPVANCTLYQSEPEELYLCEHEDSRSAAASEEATVNEGDAIA